MFNGLRSIIYPSSDLAADKKFWEMITGKKPYFDEPFYVGFDINGSELGLDPSAAKEGLAHPVTYWLVDSIADASAQIVEAGSKVHTEPNDVGGGMMMATFKDLSGNTFGIIQHPEK